MQEPKFYPLIDVDDSGATKSPLFFSKSENDVKTKYQFYLKEIITGYYNLCAGKGKMDKSVNSFTICCPICGQPMAVALKVHHGKDNIYCCPLCNSQKTTKEQKNETR